MEKKTALENKEEVVNEDENFCCSHSRRSCVFFVTQSLAVGLVLIWSMFMLTTQDERNRDLYVSLLATCLGIFIPQPSLVDTRKQLTMSQSPEVRKF